MTTVIADANILLRIAERTSPQSAVAKAASVEVDLRGDRLQTLPQSFYEFWAVATRPIANNGLGLTTKEAFAEMDALEAAFPLVADPPDLFDRWKRLVLTHDCKGKVAHDARIAAAMQAHGLAHLLTFNGGDFARFPGLVALDPHAVAAPQP